MLYELNNAVIVSHLCLLTETVQTDVCSPLKKNGELTRLVLYHSII
jgi:hypothetical protein